VAKRTLCKKVGSLTPEDKWFMIPCMLPDLEQIQARYQEPSGQTDKVAAARYLLKFAGPLFPVRTRVFEAVNRYCRILDDLVDESPSVAPVREVILTERKGLLSDRPHTELQKQYLDPVLTALGEDQGKALNRHMFRLFGGFLVDLDVKKEQRPLSAAQLKTRNFLHCWSAVAAFSLIWSGIQPIPVRDSVSLMNAWGSYDNLADLQEDLTHGLILVSREEVDNFNLQFKDGENLPADQLRGYYQRKRRIISVELNRCSGSVFKVGLPAWLAFCYFAYFQTRRLKLLGPLVMDDGAKFPASRDVRTL